MSGPDRRRDVRPTRAFYEDLSPLPGGARARRATIRLDYELPRLFRDVADRWEDLFQPIPGRPDYRTLISVGILVPMLSIDAQLGRDGVIELISLDVDVSPLSGDDVDSDGDDEDG